MNFLRFTVYVALIVALALGPAVSPAAAGLFDWMHGRNEQQPIVLGPVGPPIPAHPPGGTPVGGFVAPQAVYPQPQFAQPQVVQPQFVPAPCASGQCARPQVVCGAPACGAPVCGPAGCGQQRVIASYPPPNYRTHAQRVPVTVYQPVATINPQTGAPTTVYRACTYYTHQAQRVETFMNRAVPSPPIVNGQPVQMGSMAPKTMAAPATLGQPSCCPGVGATAIPAAQPYYPQGSYPAGTVPVMPYPGATVPVPPAGGAIPADTRPSLSPVDLPRSGSGRPAIEEAFELRATPNEVEMERVIIYPPANGQYERQPQQQLQPQPQLQQRPLVPVPDLPGADSRSGESSGNDRESAGGNGAQGTSAPPATPLQIQRPSYTTPEHELKLIPDPERPSNRRHEESEPRQQQPWNGDDVPRLLDPRGEPSPDDRTAHRRHSRPMARDIVWQASYDRPQAPREIEEPTVWRSMP